MFQPELGLHQEQLASLVHVYSEPVAVVRSSLLT